jgi:23S rRNA pseudouridine955/2504/2580 synthase
MIDPTFVDRDAAGQRLDNFLMSRLKGVPLSRIYRAIRSGEVRVNQKRASFSYRLQEGDEVRIPPLRISQSKPLVVTNQKLMNQLEGRILLEDEDLLIINKPSGLSVQRGEDYVGIIDIVSALRPELSSLKLVHRLDRETSGCLMLAKSRELLLQLHGLLRERQVEKQYIALVEGRWPGGEKRVELPLMKERAGGEWIVAVREEGKPSISVFRPLCYFKKATLMEIRLLTGRTHQARVHSAYVGHPIAGDAKYGDRVFNASMSQLGLKRLFLHSAGLQFKLGQRSIGICAMLDNELIKLIKKISD